MSTARRKASLTKEFVSTAQAAEALGVSVSTVKRWVEDGILPAQKTAGGHRKLLLADVVELGRQGKLPARDLPGLKLKFAPGRWPAIESLQEQLYSALLAGDVATVRSMFQGAYQAGMPIETLADEVVGPAMHRIGSDWESGRIDVMHEHRASQLCAAALFELKAILENRSGRDRPVAIGGALEDDYSVLPSLLAQMVLLDASWNATNLGPNTPLESFRRAIEELSPKLVWISASHVANTADFEREYKALYRDAERRGVAIVVGGRALTGPLRAAIPYTSYGDTLTHLAAFARTLNPRPKRPRRGRPSRA